MSTTKNTTTFPQTVEVPQPLEIHPSIPADLAQEMMRVADLFHRDPRRYIGDRAYLVALGLNDDSRDGCGCICAHISDTPVSASGAIRRWPQCATALTRIYNEASRNGNYNCPAWAVARIEHFLRTGE